MVAEADLGERIMRALILRRVALIQSGVGGPVLVGAADMPDIMRLQGFLTRNAHPYHVLDPETDPEAAGLVAACPLGLSDLPWVMLADGTVLHNPSESDLARRLGMGGARSASGTYDVAIVGAGPAGLATAVYAASEGLSVAVLDSRAYGGQAGASARIENYFGFPTGISGAALAGRAFVQAQKFGAEIMIPVAVKSLDCSRPDGLFGLELDGDERIRARAVVIASGARYRRPAIPDLEKFEGRGVWYWASPIEGTHAAGQEIVVVGGGNSAGQAAVYLSTVAAKVHVVIRGAGLAATMSRYLVDRIAAAPNIELHTSTEVSALAGSAHGLERVAMSNNATGAETWHDLRNVFLFVGADPATDWLSGCGVEVDKPGFVATGASAEPGRNPSGNQHPGRLCRRRRALRFGQARRQRDRRGRAGRGRTARLSLRHRPVDSLKGKDMADECRHAEMVQDVTPSARGCEECLKTGSEWVHLRLCRTCGHVGCCDDSPNKHATKHFHATQPPGHRRLRPAGRLGLVLRRRDLSRPVRSPDAAGRADSAVLLRPSNGTSAHPFIGDIAHCLWDPVLDPCHEIPVETESWATLRYEEPPHILRVAIGAGDWRVAFDLVGMPVERRHRVPRAISHRSSRR